EDRILLAEIAGDLRLERPMEIARAADEPYGAHAEPMAVHRLLRGSNQRRMIGKTKIVIGAEVENLADLAVMRHSDGAFLLGVDQLRFGGLKVHRDYEALNKLGDLRPDHMSAQQLTGPGIENRLHQALIFAERNGLAIGEKRETPDPDLATFGLGLRLGQADGSYLRMAISAARNLVLVHRMGIEALDLFHADDAFML